MHLAFLHLTLFHEIFPPLSIPWNVLGRSGHADQSSFQLLPCATATTYNQSSQLLYNGAHQHHSTHCSCSDHRHTNSMPSTPESLSNAMGQCSLQQAPVLDTQATDNSRVGRAKRVLEQTTRRVKKARIQATADQLRAKLLDAQLRLDQCTLALMQAEETKDKVPMKARGVRLRIKILQDKQALFLAAVLDAEEAVLDFTDDE